MNGAVSYDAIVKPDDVGTFRLYVDADATADTYTVLSTDGDMFTDAATVQANEFGYIDVVFDNDKFYDVRLQVQTSSQGKDGGEQQARP